MDKIIRTYEGKEIVISREDIEALGVRPGEKIEIRPEFRPVPRQLPPEEIERRRKILDEVAGSWTAEEEQKFRQARSTHSDTTD